MQFGCHAHLVVVSSLLDELVDYFLGLLVTFLLQVSDECVQMAWTVIRLYYRLMSLNYTGNTCKHTSSHKSIAHKHTHTEYQGCFLTFQEQRQSVCKYQQCSFLAQVSSCSQEQVLLSFGGKLCEYV